MLDIAAWAVIIFMLLGMASTILLIGKPRTPIGPGMALFALIMSALQIGVILALLSAAHAT